MAESRFNAEDSQLVADLFRISKKSPRLIRSTVYPVPSDPSIEIRSWKLNEFKFYDDPSPFPTLARGLFTRELENEVPGSNQHRYQIVARGYDKFFSIGEVRWTDWPSIEAHTGPDYTLSVKSNGCIIFIAAISPSRLIVMSKHVLGGMDGVEETHSQAGHRWVKKHLASKNKSEEELAASLWEKNWTAIAELCDDSFEEHVLQYPPEKAGLYLHGINETSKEFRTLPTNVIDAFAEEWGFLKTETLVLQTLEEVKKFTDEIAKTGKWRGEPLEGFVVRTKITDRKPGLATYGQQPPYPTGSSFFFKVKFDEPYMMYRDWREITKSLLSAKGPLSEAMVPRSGMKRKETRVYVEWVKNEIKTNRSVFQGYLQGKGIIATRERFLKWLDTERGKTDLSGLGQSDHDVGSFDKTIIVPVAVPGCGKTSVSVALAHLFDWGHTQSDDVPAKKNKSVFARNVVNLLKQHKVVIADKNNHQSQHRTALREATSKIYPPVRLLALNWNLDHPPAMILRMCGDRIYDRGDEHQTLRADKDGRGHEDIIMQFIKNRERLDDSEVDESVEMDINEPLEAAVVRAIDGCVQILGLERPSQEKIDKAVAFAKGYTPAKKGTNKYEKKEKEPTSPRYFAILAELDIAEAITARIEDMPSDGKKFWNKLVDDKRIADRPHITIVHKSQLPETADLWEQCNTLARLRAPPLFTFDFEYLLWNDRVMAFTVENLNLAEVPDNDDLGQEKLVFISQLPTDLREGLHVTVGTMDASIPPFEAKDLVETWRQGKRTGISSLKLEGLLAKGRIRGLML